MGNPLYANMELNDTYQDFYYLHDDEMSETPKMVVDGFTVTNVPVKRVIERYIMSYIARACPQEDDTEEAVYGINTVMIIPIPHCSDNTSLYNEVLLEDTLGRKDYENPLVSNCLGVPTNEFSDNNNLHSGTLPWMFLLENGL